ncbi:MAG TPA: serine esterase [Verrucomicrobiae bacterium]
MVYSMLQTELVRARVAGSKDLLIALHGLGDSMEGYRWVPEMIGAPTLNVLLVNAPDAYYGGFSWYEYAGPAEVTAQGVERSYRLVEGLLNKCVEDGFATERTILFGFSQGCLMCTETAVRYSKRLAGVIGVSGYIYDVQRLLKLASPVAKEQKFLITHGTDDPLIPLRNAQADFGTLKAEGFQVDFRTYPKVHTIIEPELELFRGFIAERFKN